MFDDLLLPSSIGSVHDLERSRTMTSELRRGDQERASGGEAAGAGSSRAGTPWRNESSKARIRDSVPRGRCEEIRYRSERRRQENGQENPVPPAPTCLRNL